MPNFTRQQRDGKEVLTQQEYLSEMFIAGETIGAKLFVYCNPTDGKVYLPSNVNNDHFGKIVGITLTGASADERVEVVKKGVVTKASWGLTAGKYQFYEGTSGLINDDPPTTGWLQNVGFSRTTEILEVNLVQPIKLV